MPHTLTYDTTLRVEDPIDFESDAKRHALRILRDRLDGVCFKNARIIRVVDIRHISDCTIVAADLDACGVVHVQFVAEVETFPQWEVLVGVKITRTSPAILGEYGRCAVVQFLCAETFQHPAVVNSLKVGFVIPARVVMAHYPHRVPRANVIAVPLTCDVRSPAWRIASDLTPDQAEHLMQFIAVLNTELTYRAELDDKSTQRCRFLELVLYAFNTDPSKSQETALASS